MMQKKSGTEKVTFDSTIYRFDSDLWHFHFPVKSEMVKDLIKDKNRRVVCNLSKVYEFQCALMPDGNGDFFINVNQEIRKKLKLDEGSKVTVALWKDESEYGLPIPPEFEELLIQDEEGAKLFHALTPGKIRTLLHIIAKPKNTMIRLNCGLAVLHHLKHQKGKIEYKQLQIDLKSFKNGRE